MPSIDWMRVGVILAAIIAAALAAIVQDVIVIDLQVAQTLIGTFSVLAGFLVSALAFIRPADLSTIKGKATDAEIRRRTIRLSAFFYLYLLNIILLLAYSVIRETPTKPFDLFGKVALSLSVFSLVVSLEVPRMVLKLRSFQR